MFSKSCCLLIKDTHIGIYTININWYILPYSHTYYTHTKMKP